MRVIRVFAWVAGSSVLVALFLYAMRYEIARMQEGLPGFTHTLGDEYFEMVKMHDGVSLATSIHLPDGEGSFSNRPDQESVC